ncbi:MAG: ribose ABC transporter [Pelagibacteraceae bacterium]|jgi:L-fucose mutarotase|nr:ribose ABC transporter [Pelagibacteraceae bacterium]|tara:strand:+ start:470 stop:928 length:459 start_codon:yes stop_codon:yes gene_type:complete
MLIKIDPILNPDILYTLRSMGHGDRLVLCDSNFPAYSTNENVHRLDGVNISRAAQAILSVFPLDSFIPSPVQRMEIDGKPDEINEVHQELMDVVKEVSGSHWKVSSIERQKFYELANESFAVITTNETRPFGCFIFTKGVIKPDGNVWLLDS